MSDIPEDIREAALTLLSELDDCPGYQEEVDAIAQALLSERMKERERAARVASEWFYHTTGWPSEELASAIRSGD